MRTLIGKPVVETDCPNCDLIERRPLSSVRRARVFSCRGCAHRYAVDRGGVGGIEGETNARVLYARAVSLGRPLGRVRRTRAAKPAMEFLFIWKPGLDPRAGFSIPGPLGGVG